MLGLGGSGKKEEKSFAGSHAMQTAHLVGQKQVPQESRDANIAPPSESNSD